MGRPAWLPKPDHNGFLLCTWEDGPHFPGPMDLARKTSSMISHSNVLLEKHSVSCLQAEVIALDGIPGYGAIDVATHLRSHI